MGWSKDSVSSLNDPKGSVVELVFLNDRFYLEKADLTTIRFNIASGLDSSRDYDTYIMLDRLSEEQAGEVIRECPYSEKATNEHGQNVFIKTLSILGPDFGNTRISNIMMWKFRKMVKELPPFDFGFAKKTISRTIY